MTAPLLFSPPRALPCRPRYTLPGTTAVLTAPIVLFTTFNRKPQCATHKYDRKQRLLRPLITRWAYAALKIAKRSLPLRLSACTLFVHTEQGRVIKTVSALLGTPP